MKKALLIFFTILMICAVFTSCADTESEPSTTVIQTTEKAPGKYANSEYVGTWNNADGDKRFICTLNDDGSAIFKEDKKATWEETATGIIIHTTTEDKAQALEGYFVIAGEGYVARATEANMHYLDEGGVKQLEIMLTENTCVDCTKN